MQFDEADGTTTGKAKEFDYHDKTTRTRVVTLLDGDDRVIAQSGDGHPTKLRNAPRNAFIPGKFIHPRDAMFLHNGDILVTEWVPIGRVTLLKKV